MEQKTNMNTDSPTNLPPGARRITETPKPGDYVLATKYSDGDPQDHWAVGFYDRTEGDRHFIKDNAGNQLRANGFRRVGRITPTEGAWLLGKSADVERSGKSVWDFVNKPEAPAPLGELHPEHASSIAGECPGVTAPPEEITEKQAASPERELLGVALALIERDLRSAPSFDGFYTRHREFVARAKAMNIQPAKLNAPAGF
jgi:hypothetical protein